MRFKISLRNNDGHKGLVACIAWNASEDIYSCGEDHLLLCWKLEGGIAHPSVITTFPADFCPTDMQWHPRPTNTSTSSKKQSLDVLLISTADGKFHLVNKTGRIEKSVDAHKGATLVGRWNNDGSALLTAGEDGLIKIWSRSGMLRSTVVRGGQPVLSAAWSPDSLSILYTLGAHLLVQSFNSNAKPHKWHAHDGLILAIAWNQRNSLIVSAGEDCRYKIWDRTGNQLYASSATEYPITSIAWCANGDYFAVGSFNTVRLCDKTGWSHSLEKVGTGSIYSIAWSNDGTQVAMACGGGIVLTAHVIDRRLEWNNYEATLVSRKTIRVREVSSERHETLDISDRVIKLEFGFGHLVVITPSQCHVYGVANWNTPAIFDLKNGSVTSVILADKHFILVEWNTISLYSYQGRLLGVPRWKGMTQEPVHTSCIALCSDTLVIRDQSNDKLLHVIEVSSHKPITEGQPYTHFHGVSQLSLNHVGSTAERQLAVVDVNRDLFLISIRANGFGRCCKIAVMAQGIQWATDANIFAAMLNVTLSVWLCPNCVHYSDRKMIRKTRIDSDNSEFGKQPSIASVHEGLITVRRGDGALVTSAYYTFFIGLHQHVMNNKWKDALSLCRIAQNEILWTCVAVLATEAKELDVAEESYAAICRFDKVAYIQRVKQLSNKVERLAAMALLTGDLLAAEGILLQNGLVAEAIHTNLKMFNWNRALELATKHKKELDKVLSARREYLSILNKQETNPQYLNHMTNELKQQQDDLKFERTTESEKAENQPEKLSFLEL
ncbi:intraflagellar transport protein 80 homolog [Athalia rosae]|uniref:intraflagellar transport protein 80 homolog n=1 Tax=Athalia rosae TaxID=37344 RepID=UPI002033F6B7|nr:intraflagellar transport protein 80 homolog [Athalia rosae]